MSEFIPKTGEFFTVRGYKIRNLDDKLVGELFLCLEEADPLIMAFQISRSAVNCDAVDMTADKLIFTKIESTHKLVHTRINAARFALKAANRPQRLIHFEMLLTDGLLFTVRACEHRLARAIATAPTMKSAQAELLHSAAVFYQQFGEEIYTKLKKDDDEAKGEK